MKKLHYPSNLVNKDLNPAFIQFAYFHRDDKMRLSPKTMIQLSMPEQISQPSTVSWDNEKFGMAGKIISDGIKKVSGSNEGTMDMNSMIDAVSQRVKQGAMFNIAAVANKGLGGGASAEGMMGEVTGRIPNPYVTAIFRGVNFRTFDFVFKFTPLSEKDCELINNIVKEMRSNALPESMDSSAFLSYPYECQISYFWKGKRNAWLNRFKRAACTKVDVNYAGTGSFTAMRNGFPTQIIVSTTWTELELVTRSDVTDGGY